MYNISIATKRSFFYFIIIFCFLFIFLIWNVDFASEEILAALTFVFLVSAIFLLIINNLKYFFINKVNLIYSNMFDLIASAFYFNSMLSAKYNKLLLILRYTNIFKILMDNARFSYAVSLNDLSFIFKRRMRILISLNLLFFKVRLIRCYEINNFKNYVSKKLFSHIL